MTTPSGTIPPAGQTATLRFLTGMLGIYGETNPAAIRRAAEFHGLTKRFNYSTEETVSDLLKQAGL